ncbi:MAG: M14 family metallopeptidase [Vicinamibacterales bacterium]
MRLLTTALLLALSSVGPSFAQTLEPLWPGAKYDAAIPTLKQIVGHEPGIEISSPDQIGQYLQALATAAPSRTRLVEYARSWEGRPLWLLVVGNPDRMQRLDQVKADLKKLADPRAVSAAEADRLVNELPVVVWLVHGVHGNEISSSDAALQEAYHLLAAQGDAGVDAVLRDALVLIDPMQNPDGRARFLFQNLQGRAATPDPAPFNAEHDEPWPGGRSNHYLFDMNRDWFAQTQPETRGRLQIALDYWPHVNVDLHEQGGDNTYYFAPPADPLNPHITKSQVAAFELFGRANAARFDERGWPYFIREVYDSFYPGYGESWPIFQGSIGMTYEQASARSLAYAREDGTTLTYRDGVMRHFNAAIITAITAATNRERLLRDFREYRRGAVAEGENGPVREYLLVPGHDPSRADRLARNLATQGIEVRRAEEPVTTGSRTLPRGTYLVSNAQPTGRLIRNLLDIHTAQPDEFVTRQEARRARRQPDQIYDITAWSLPLLYDVEVVTSATALSPTSADGPPTLAPGRADEGKISAKRPERAARADRRQTVVRTTPVPMAYDAPPPPRNFVPGTLGYLLPWGTAAAALTVDALQQGIRVQHAGGAFTLQGRPYPIGTGVIRNAGNPADLHARLTALATEYGADIIPIDSAYVDSGTSLGSNDVVALKAPKVLLAWDAPTQPLSAGWTRYVLERRFGQAVTVVRAASLGRVDFSRFDVVVLPSGNFAPTIGDALVARLKDWLRAGGTLVTLADATRWATANGVGLLDTTMLLRDGRPDIPAPAGQPTQGGQAAQGAQGGSPGEPASQGAKPAAAPAAFDYDKAIQPEREQPDAQPGAILRGTLDTDHWLSAGSDGETQLMVEGNRVLAPIKLNAGRNVGIYARKDRLIASGLVWPENQDLLVQKPFLIHQPFGQGHVIAFAEDANYRAFAEATMLLFVNAVLLGPGY